MRGTLFTEVIQASLVNLWVNVLNILPDIIGALIIVFIGLIVAPIFGGIAKKVIDILKIDMLLEKAGVHEVLKGYFNNISVSLLIGKLVKWFFVIAFFMAASETLGWTQLTLFLNSIVLYIPDVLIAVIIIVISVIAGKFFETVVTRSLNGSEELVNNPGVLGKFTKWSFTVFGVLVALLQLGVAPSLIEILFGGLVLALALAFGLGGREKAAQMLDKLDAPKKKSGKSKKSA